MSDLIDRQLAISELMPIYKSASLRNRNVFSTARKCMDIIVKLPSAEKTGKWISKGQNIFCSVCGEESAYNCYGASKFSNYCPNCGALMRGEEDADKITK